MMQMASITAIVALPWFFKILYGVVSDNFPLFGYRRKSYLAISACVAVLCSLVLATFRYTSFSYYATVLFLSSAASCMLDVIIDGYVVERSTDVKHANDYQNLSWGSRALGAASSSWLGGWLAAHFGIYQVFWMQVPIVCIQLPLALLLEETKMSLSQLHQSRAILKDSLIAPVREFFANKQLLWMTLFLLLTLFSPSYGVPFLFRMRDVLHFSPEFIGLLGSLESVGQIIGCFLFARFFSNVSIKKLLYVSVFIWAVNTAVVLAIVGNKSSIVVAMIGAITGYVSFVPIFSIAAKICQKTKFEATMFAILMSFFNLARQGSGVLGAWLYDYTGFFWLVVISTVTTFMVLPIISKLDA